MGVGMARQAHCYYIQEILRNMNLQNQPPHSGMPVCGGHNVTPETGQYDSPDLDDQEDELTSQPDLNSEEEYTDATRHSA